ncbi:SDR family oxidoreductase [Streptomyces sp. SID8382]|uniref:SDR family oxidoreductase n=1 Tax=Streptomyces malaysiensis TaxID=92644 RepID=UPI000C2C34A8|nr:MULTISPECIES: SDR family oxidoreductase [unclassified Streptomyces]AUA07941.1 Enoyl-[acyl-carrier-protein] reductase [NADPH] FabL [Streptomyces sp. M56]MYX62501.1 SDR family oxidoreductase [Streptomyces sp. SID8382]
MTDLSGKVAVVTGASRGIGRAVAVRLGQLGANVVVNYSRDASGAAATVAEIEATGSRAIDVRADVSKPDEIEALLDTARSRFGGLDIVVANAGLDEGLGPLLDVTEAEYDRMFNVNAKGAFFTLQKAGRMVDSGGSIVYIGSSSTLRPQPGFGLYTSSKLPPSFLVGILAQEIGERGVTVNAVIPTATDGAGYFSAGNDDSQFRSLVQNTSPLGSRMGTVDDVADAVEFFTGTLARWISGQQLLVSGGAPT